MITILEAGNGDKWIFKGKCPICDCTFTCKLSDKGVFRERISLLDCICIKEGCPDVNCLQDYKKIDLELIES
jgi:hypothetical protein